MKKKLLTVLLATTMVAGALTGCGSSTETAKDVQTSAAETSESEEQETESQDAQNTDDSAEVTATELNIAIQPSGAFIPLIIARSEGWLEEALAEYGVTVNWTDFEAGPPINESMAAGSSDVGTLGDVPAVSAIAAGQDNVVVSIAAEGPNAYALLVKADSDIESVSDLEGKTIATVVGSTGHNLVEKLLSQEGLDIDSDVEFVNISAGDAAAVLETGEADAVAIWEPNVTRLVENGTAKAIAYGRDCGLLGVNPLMINRAYAESNPKIVEIINEQYKRGVEAIDTLDGDTLAYVSEYLSLEESQVATVAGNWDYTVDIKQDDIDGLQDTIQFLVKIGNLSEEYDISDYIYKQ